MTSDMLASVSFVAGGTLHGLSNQTPGDRACQWAATVLSDLPGSSGSSAGDAERRDHRVGRRGQMDSEDNTHRGSIGPGVAEVPCPAIDPWRVLTHQWSLSCGGRWASATNCCFER